MTRPFLPAAAVTVLAALAAATALLAAGASGASAAGSPPSAPSDDRAPYLLLQMNLCLSGLAGCYAGAEYPAVVDEAIAKIRETRPGAVTLNEACSGDVERIARETGYDHRFATVIYRDAPLPCRNPEGRGVFGNAVLARDAITVSESEAFEAQLGAEERRWLCVLTAGDARAFTAHLSVAGSAQQRATNDAQCEELTTVLPDIKVLILSMHDDEQYLFDALHVGAAGYVLKSVMDRELVEACRSVMRGEPFIFPSGLQASSTATSPWIASTAASKHLARRRRCHRPSSAVPVQQLVLAHGRRGPRPRREPPRAGAAFGIPGLFPGTR